MKYRIVWSRFARNELAAIWLNSADRNAVTEATELIEKRLSFYPETAGESRDKERRILFEGPIHVLFRIMEDVKKVRILHVRPMRRKG